MRTLLAALALAAACSAAPTHVVGTLQTARATGDYATYSGYVTLSYQTFTAPDNSIYPARTVRLDIVAGRFDVQLQPGTYLLSWGNLGGTETRTLTVPVSSTAVDLAACLTTTPADPLAQIPLMQLSPSGATLHQVAAWDGAKWAPADPAAVATLPISGVIGLQTALTAATAAATAETSTRAAADSAEASARAAAITGEAGTRAAADATNAAAITSEAGTRAAADTANAGAIASETTARQADTATSSSAIGAEASTRAAADTAEATARATHSARVDNPHSVTAAQVGAPTAAALTSEASTRAAADTAHDSAIAAETAARIAADSRSYTASFTAQVSVTIAGSTHNLGSRDLHTDCFDATGARYEPDLITIDPATYDVTIAHAIAQSGRCVLTR